MSLIKACRYPGSFSPSFCELQRDFVKHRPTKLKSLLRLVKHWYLQVRGCPDGAEGGMEEPGEEKAEARCAISGNCLKERRRWLERDARLLNYQVKP